MPYKRTLKDRAPSGRAVVRLMNEEAIACRSCGTRIRFRKAPRLGQHLTCPQCGTRLEVIGVGPVEIDWSFEAPLDEAATDVVADDLAGEPGLAII